MYKRVRVKQLHASQSCAVVQCSMRRGTVFINTLAHPQLFIVMCARFSALARLDIQLCASESTPREPVLRSRVGPRLHSSRFGAFVVLAAPRYALQYISLAHQHVDLACCARVSDVARVDVQACASEATPREPVLRSSPVLHASRYCFYKYLSTPTTFYSNVCAVFSFSTSGYTTVCE